MTQQAPVAIIEVRVLEGPNLYFPRPAAKLTIAVPGFLTAPETTLEGVVSALGIRLRQVGEPGTELREHAVLRVFERLVRRIASRAGISRLAVRARPTNNADQIVVAFALRTRGRAQVLADALLQVAQGMLTGQDPEPLIEAAARQVKTADPGTPIRPLRPKVPVVAVTGTNGKTTTTRLIAHLAMTAGKRTGWSSTEGVLVQGELIESGDYSGPGGARKVLESEGIQFAVLETARGGMLLRGLGTAYNDVSLVTNVSADHLGQNGVDTVDQLAEVKAIITKVTKPSGWVVLNGDDPRVWSMRVGASAPVWCFSLDAGSPALREALSAHGRGITILDGDIVVLLPGQSPRPLLPLIDVPMTLSGLSTHHTADALAGAAAALGAGLDEADVIEGLRTFTPDPQHNAGRMNLYTVPLDGRPGEVTVIVDMAHNEGGLEALLDVAIGLRAPGCAVDLGLGTGGDRTDDIIRALGEMAGLRADRVHIEHKEHYLRGRTMADLEAKFVEGLARAGATAVASAPTELEGLQQMLAMARDGDVLAEMVHSDQPLIHRWLWEHGGRVDGPAQVRRKVIAARGEHEAEDRIATIWRIEDPDQRIAAAAALREDYPDDGRVLYEYAGTYDSAGQEDSALHWYDEALARGLREPFRRRALIQKASTLRHLGQTVQSRRILAELMAEWPDNAAIPAFYALSAADDGDERAGLAAVLQQLVRTSGDPDVARYRHSLTRFSQALDQESP